MAGLPDYLNPAIGYALWHLTQPGERRMSGTDIIEHIMARGWAMSRDEARAALRQARSNIAAQRRVVNASTASSLKAGCDYKCDDNTPIALRIRFDATGPDGRTVESRSIVVNAKAGENIQTVLDRARAKFNRRFRRGTDHQSGPLKLERQLTPADIDQVLLNYEEGI